MNTRPRAALVGCGAIGTQHARILANLEGAEFVAILDSQLQRTHVHGVPVVRNVEALLSYRPDYCVVATPTSTHADVALDLIGRGIACLIEKPLANTAEQAAAIADAAVRADVLVGVGHIERFNPSIQELKRRVLEGQLGRLIQISTRRYGPYPARINDVGVILDLASHDIHSTLWVTDASYESLDSRRVALLRREAEDLLLAIGTMKNGVVVSHAVNWISPSKERTFAALGERGALVADTLTGDLTFYENGTEPLDWDQLTTLRGPSEGNITRYAIHKMEPLLAEHLGFLRAFTTGDMTGLVHPSQATEVLRVAERMLA